MVINIAVLYRYLKEKEQANSWRREPFVFFCLEEIRD